jgi:cell pole-organizing protein PopZ
MPDKAKSPPEPSMEEIIASISRIITEDKKPGDPVRPAREENDDILELTEVVNEDGSMRRVIPAAPEAAAPAGDPAGDRDLRMSTPSAPPLPTAEPEIGIEPKLDVGRERIVSTATSGAVAAAFAQLGTLPRERREAELPLGASDRTLEGVVRDMLRPFLETWLNEHLPGIVERLVRQEIARVVGEAGLR